MAHDDLTLYHFDACPYCRRVRRTLDALGVSIELRDIRLDARAREELQAARGRTTVPVLRIEREGGPQWLPESRDIAAYLRGRFEGEVHE